MNDFLQKWQDSKQIPGWRTCVSDKDVHYLFGSFKVQDIQQAYELAGHALKIGTEHNIETKFSLDISQLGLGIILYADESKEVSEKDYQVAAKISKKINAM